MEIPDLSFCDNLLCPLATVIRFSELTSLISLIREWRLERGNGNVEIPGQWFGS